MIRSFLFRLLAVFLLSCMQADRPTGLGEFEVDGVTNEGEGWSFKARSMAHCVRDTDGEWRIRMFLLNNPAEGSS